MITAPGITVNDVHITPEQINSEVQYHPANSLFDAKYEAMQSLVIRELLLQRAVNLGLWDEEKDKAKADDALELLFEKEINVPTLDDKTCEHFYNNNTKRFFTSPLFEASHILYLLPPDDEEAKTVILEKAQKTLENILKDPSKFEKIAETDSACSSAKMGGNLGQITKGQTTPVFEKALFKMHDGEISKKPLVSEFGCHIIKVHKRLEGKQLPFNAVKEWIADYLEQQSWQRAFSQYVQILAGQANISGFKLKQSDSPLVQ